MAAYQKFQPFIGKAFNGEVNLATDVCMVALTNVLPVATAATIGEINEISYTNCTSRVLEEQTSVETGGIYKFGVKDLTLTATGGPVGAFRWVVVYDSTAGGSLIAWFDYGVEGGITLQDTETLTVNFSEQNGLFTAV